MDNNKIYELLYQKNCDIYKRINKGIILLYILPLIYLLIDNSFVSEVKTPFVAISKIELILLIYPLLYTFLLLYIKSYFNKFSSINREMEKIEENYPSLTKDVKKLLIDPPFLLDSLISEGGGVIYGCLNVVFVILPSLIIFLLVPFAFLAYAIYRNIIYTGELKTISIWVSVFAIWVLLGFIYQFLGIRNDKDLKKYMIDNTN